MDYEQAHAPNRAIRTIGMRHRALAGSALQRIGLTVGQEALIMDLAERGPRTQAQLAAAASCELPTITSTVTRAEGLDMVARRPSMLDKRAAVVELTERGQDLDLVGRSERGRAFPHDRRGPGRRPYRSRGQPPYRAPHHLEETSRTPPGTANPGAEPADPVRQG